MNTWDVIAWMYGLAYVLVPLGIFGAGFWLGCQWFKKHFERETHILVDANIRKNRFYRKHGYWPEDELIIQYNEKQLKAKEGADID